MFDVFLAGEEEGGDGISFLLNTAPVLFNLKIPAFGLQLMLCRWFCKENEVGLVKLISLWLGNEALSVKACLRQDCSVSGQQDAFSPQREFYTPTCAHTQMA